MKLITRESNAAGAAERWREQYCHDGKWRDTKWDSGEDRRRTYEKLLGGEQTADRVEKILNVSWTSTCCQECQDRGIPVVQLGEDPDYDSATLDVCVPCLGKAIALASA